MKVSRREGGEKADWNTQWRAENLMQKQTWASGSQRAEGRDRLPLVCVVLEEVTKHFTTIFYSYAVSQQPVQFALDCQASCCIIPAMLISGKYKPREMGPSLGEIQCNHSVPCRQMQACCDTKLMQVERFSPGGSCSWHTAIPLVAGHGCNPRTALEQGGRADVWALSSSWM